VGCIVAPLRGCVAVTLIPLSWEILSVTQTLKSLNVAIGVLI